jgi:hypothetical protein
VPCTSTISPVRTGSSRCRDRMTSRSPTTAFISVTALRDIAIVHPPCGPRKLVVGRATPGSADDGRPGQAAGCGRVPRTHQGGGARARRATPGGAIRGPRAKRADRAAPRPREIAAAAKAGRLIRLADDILPVPGAVELAVRRLRDLPQPFTSARRGSPSAPRAGSRCRYSSTSTALASPSELTIGTADWSSGASAVDKRPTAVGE